MAIGAVEEPVPPSAPPTVPRVELVESPSPLSPRAGAAMTAVPEEGRMRTSQRVILHIVAQGRPLPGDVAPFGLSQAGIGEALDLTQSSLAKTLGRLVAAGVLTVERRHVRHQDRRLKVYELTPLGESLARDLRRRSVRPAGDRSDRDRFRPIQYGR